MSEDAWLAEKRKVYELKKKTTGTPSVQDSPILEYSKVSPIAEEISKTLEASSKSASLPLFVGYYVEWKDSVINPTHGWADASSISEWASMPPSTCVSAGLLVFENDEYLVLAQSFDLGPTPTEEIDNIMGCLKIPKSAIMVLKSMV